MGWTPTATGRLPTRKLQSAQKTIAAMPGQAGIRINRSTYATGNTEHQVAQYPDGIYAVMDFELPEVRSPRALT